MNKGRKTADTRRIPLKNIQKNIFRTQLIVIISLALLLGAAGTLINIHFETEKRDQNLENMAEAIAQSPTLTGKGDLNTDSNEVYFEYLDTLKDTLDDVDVISIVNKEGIRVYHSNHTLIGTEYDGDIPSFKGDDDGYYAVNENGPSGKQRRAYAAIYNEDGEYAGMVMVIMLVKNIKNETLQLLCIFFAITVMAILIELVLAGKLSGKIKKSLMGYEPDVFTAMYRMRDNILESLAEGIIAADMNGIIQFSNSSATRMLCGNPEAELTGQNVDVIGDKAFSRLILNGHYEKGINLADTDIIVDCVPIKENGDAVGAIAILHDRAEYTRLMEELSGTRYLVDSMRANNHDFTNKLHVILGLIQMEMYDDASSYIQTITMVQRENISRVMNAVSEPAVAALLIGKIARASELNVKFKLRSDSHFSAIDMNLPSEMLITVIGNLLDNALEAMNECDSCKRQKELIFGIYSKPGALLITVDDTGNGIKPEDMDRIFENGYSTKGEGRGTGLYQVKSIVENSGGSITVESKEGAGTSFSVNFTKENKDV